MTEKNEGAAPLACSNELLAACDMLADYTGSCPHDLHDWEHPETCETHCGDNVPSGCWVKYVQSIVANAPGEPRLPAKGKL